MKIKTHKYLEELAKAEKRGYEKGLREGEQNCWRMEREAEKARCDEEFRARVLKKLDAHERKFAALCGEADAEKPASVDGCDGKCECGPVVNCTVAE